MTEFVPTHRTPAGGLPARDARQPDAAEQQVPGDLDVSIVEMTAQGWTRVRFANGWEALVDGSRLVLHTGTAPAAGSRWLVPAVIAVVVVVAAVAAVVLLGGSDDEAPTTTAVVAGDEEDEADTSAAAEEGQPQSDAPQIDAVVDDQLAVDWSTVEAAAPPADPADAMVGGAPETTRARAVRAALEQTGVDLTGLGLHVLPVTGSTDQLLVLELTDDSALAESEDDSGASDRFVLALVDQMEQHGIERLVLNYRGVDEGEPIVVTATASLEELQAAAAGEADPAEVIRIQLERGR